MELDELQWHWDAMGRDDPMWAVLTFADKRHGRWDKADFMATGPDEVARYLRYLDARPGIGPDWHKGRALDFGCGPGRLAQALCAHFERVDGVDIAPSMIALADDWNEYGDRCRYHVNDSADLALFSDDTFDLVLSFQVLQHIEPRHQLDYITEFARCLRPGGVALFQVVTEEKIGATGPLPERAFRAEITLPDDLPALPAGRAAGVPVTVSNRSSEAWPMMGEGGWFCVTVGNHWLDAHGTVVVVDDGRAHLPADVAPGAEARLVLSVIAPDTPGRYLLEVDLVQEGVTWFAPQGSPTARLAVTVVEAPAAGDTDAAIDRPRMEMHVVSVDACREALARAGAELLAATPRAEVLGGIDGDFERTFIVGHKPA